MFAHGIRVLGDQPMKTFAFTTAAVTTLFAFVGTANADETQSVPFEPSYEDRISEFPWESNYFPSSGPLQVKLGAAAYQELSIEMDGDAEYAWEGDSFALRGVQDGGSLLSTIGADVTVTVAYDVLGFAGEIEIGVYSISEDVGQTFTPYVLDGAADRPVASAFEVGPFNLVDEPFTVGSGTGNFKLDFRIDSPGITFEGTEVQLRTDQGSAGPEASIIEEGQVVGLAMPGQPGERVSIYGTEYGLINSEVSMHLMPTVELSIFGVDLAIGPFDIEMEYPLLEGQEIQFDDVAMEFDIPEAPEDPEDPSDDGDDDDDDDDEPEPADDDDDDEPEPADDDDDDEPEDDDDEPMGDSAGLGGVEGEDGCGCSANGRGPNTLAFGLMTLGLLGLRRRRN